MDDMVGTCVNYFGGPAVNITYQFRKRRPSTLCKLK